MSITISGRQINTGTFGPRPFRDLCELLALVRAKRSEYFGRLFRSWSRSHRHEPGNNGDIR